MLGFELLEVAIGLALVFLLLSLVASVATEWISRMLAMRSKTLQSGIRNLLGNDEIANDIYIHPIIKGLYKKGWSDRLLDKLPIVGGRLRQGRPSNIPSRLFALTLLDTVMKAGSMTDAPKAAVDITEEGKSRELQQYAKKTFAELEQRLKNSSIDSVKEPLLRLLESAKSETERWDQALANFRASVESWFDEAMDRVSGWYKRQAQLIVFGVALAVVVFLNADTIAISNALSRDDALRAAAVAAAERRAEQGVDAIGDSIESIRTELDSLNLPIGWVRSTEGVVDPREVPGDFRGWLFKLFGFLITAFAVSLGAPFWFDALSRLVNIRSRGRTPVRSSG
ncbi:MAG: hypothetical protein L0177_17490 [Chloroflexi bacterium]|nr:hypothetical protein [Chloroflexota bacterium]